MIFPLKPPFIEIFQQAMFDDTGGYLLKIQPHVMIFIAPSSPKIPVDLRFQGIGETCHLESIWLLPQVSDAKGFTFDVVNLQVNLKKRTASNNVLLVKIEGPVWYTIYHRLPVVSRGNKPIY